MQELGRLDRREAPRSGWDRVFDLGADLTRLETEERRRIRLVTLGSLAVMAVGIPAAAQYAILGAPGLGAALVVAIALAGANLIALRRTLRPRLHGHLGLAIMACCLTLVSLGSGGFADPNFSWFYVMPVGAAVVVGLAGAWAWTLVTLAIALGFWMLPGLGVELPHVVPEEMLVTQHLIDRVTAITALGLVATAFVTAERRANRELARANRDIRREAAYVQMLEHAAVSANEATDFDEALRDGIRRISEAMDWPVGHCFVRADDGSLVSSGFLHFTDPVFQPLADLTRLARYRAHEGLVGQALAASRPVAHRDLRERLQGRAPTARRLGLQAAVAVPVRVHGRVAAVLEFACRQPLPDDPRLFEVLDHVGHQLGRVAERTTLQSLLQQAQKMEAVGRLAAGIAHEVNNPLSFVRSNLSHLDGRTRALRTHDALSPAQVSDFLRDCEELCDECIQGVDRIVEIVREVRDFSRAARSPRETVELDAEIEGALRVAGAQAPPGVVLEGRSDCPPLPGSAVQLRQVLVNLVVNAIQAVGETGRVVVDAKREAGEAVVRVSDDGPGIDPGARERLFEPFFTTKAVGQGTGLGLYISYEIVRNHGGEIRVESEPGAGATFELRLPLETPDAALRT